jgi:methionyl-tRNA formyltransferase
LTTYHFKDVLVISDNLLQCTRILALIKRAGLDQSVAFTWACSKYSSPEEFEAATGVRVHMIDLKKNSDVQMIISNYSLVISVHCKQLFPTELVDAVTCINIHPGYNPDNRGWYPQVFSILNHTVIGATIHLIDQELDHGAIIDRMQVPQYGWDTSKDVYDRVLDAELTLVERNLEKILRRQYETIQPEVEGKVYLKKDFHQLCELDPDEINTLQYFIDKLRALTHGDFKNSYFTDKQSGKRIFVDIRLRPE